MIRKISKRGRGDTAGVYRSGVVAVEFALIAPVMFLLAFGMIEVGSIMLVKNSLTQASRIGARAASLPGSTNAIVNAQVTAELQIMSLTRATVEISPSNVSLAPPGSNVTVTVRIPPSEVGWLPRFLKLPLNDISAQSTMRREST
jgi:Flp pilus assembly protein TadG